MRRTIHELDLAGKRVLARVDFNVPMKDRQIVNDRRMRAALPTIQHCIDQGAKLILMTHVGRPKGERKAELSTGRLIQRLSELLPGVNVSGAEQVVGQAVRSRTDEMAAGDVLLLENLRFEPGEKQADEGFARALRELGDLYVNDAFAACHRKHASTYTAAQLFPENARAIGLLVKREIEALGRLLESPAEPVIAILGGAKVADKLPVIDKLLDRVDRLLLGGMMAYTLLRFSGTEVGASPVEHDQQDSVRRLLEKGGDRILLPVDHVIADDSDSPSQMKEIQGDIPDGWYGMDMGPRTLQRYGDILQQAGSILWNGPVGKFEDQRFQRGTETIAQMLAGSAAFTVVGGGETGEAVDRFAEAQRIDHVSTGGGAFLEYLEQGTLPALEVIPIEQHAISDG